MLRLWVAILFIGGPILALVFSSWGLRALLVFGLGAIVLVLVRSGLESIAANASSGRTLAGRCVLHDRRLDAPAV
jgi:hypothetical protein